MDNTIDELEQLNKKLHQAQKLIIKERTEKQHAIQLLKTKINKINELQHAVTKMNENMRCRQQHVSIEQNNYKNAKNKITYLNKKLQEATTMIQQNEQTISDLKIEHEEAMRRTKHLIEGFYKDQFAEESEDQEFIE